MRQVAILTNDGERATNDADHATAARRRLRHPGRWTLLLAALTVLAGIASFVVTVYVPYQREQGAIEELKGRNYVVVKPRIDGILLCGTGLAGMNIIDVEDTSPAWIRFLCEKCRIGEEFHIGEGCGIECFERVVEVDIYGNTKLSESDIQRLETFTQLRSLTMPERAASNESIAALRRRYPHAEIKTFERTNSFAEDLENE